MHDRDWTKHGDHWSLMIVSKSEANEPALFAHVDSCPDEAREPAFDLLVERVKEHIAAVCFANIDNECERNRAIINIGLSRTLHSKDVKSPTQPGWWECGYNVMYTSELMTRNNCRVLSALTAKVEQLNLMTIYEKDAYDAMLFRTELATRAIKASEDQMLSRWINNTALADSTVWLPCQVLDTIDLGHFGVWHRLSYQIGTNSVRMWCKLPINGCAYWKHTH